MLDWIKASLWFFFFFALFYLYSSLCWFHQVLHMAPCVNSWIETSPRASDLYTNSIWYLHLDIKYLFKVNISKRDIFISLPYQITPTPVISMSKYINIHPAVKGLNLSFLIPSFHSIYQLLSFVTPLLFSSTLSIFTAYIFLGDCPFKTLISLKSIHHTASWVLFYRHKLYISAQLKIL